MSALLQVRNLVKHFPVRKGLFGRRVGLVKAVDDLSFDVDAGETLALVGESGCGKSTTGRCVLRLIDPTSGSVMFDGVDVMTLNDGQMRAKRRDMQIIFQDPYASLNPRMTVSEILGEPLRLHGLASGGGVATRVAELMALVGLSPHFARRYPHEFSGGQRQRIGIARALAVEPRLIIGDEPVSALDVSIQAQVINLLADLKARFKLAFVLIAHDLAVVKHVADRVAVMYLGKIVEIADKRSLFAQPRHPYTRALLAAIPRPDPSRKRNQPLLQGDVPSPLNPPSGCRFHTRCPYVQERCRREDPALAPDAAGHATACHFWSTLPPAEGITTAAAPGHQRLARLQRYFVEGRAVAPAPPPA